MFAFHRPKIYRSINGCCICRAKSSSSRFTDSKKYENEFKLCFDLGEEQKRAGEICNACVLLIKRWKKLPKGTERNWNHVVDARAGPGGKSLIRSKLKHTSMLGKSSPSSGLRGCNIRKRKHRSVESIRKMRLMDRLTRPSGEDPDKPPLSPTASESSNDELDEVRSREGLELMTPQERFDLPPSLRAILDTTYWKMEQICCGTIFKGGRGEVLIEPTLFKPCTACSGSSSPPSPARRSGYKTADTKRDARPDSLGSDDSLEISDREEIDECIADDETTSTEGDVLETLMGFADVATPEKGVVTVGNLVTVGN
ncbi:SIN3-HDAC complex-associated factor-like [Asterias amurensis]|uniref:SIN3-HDAC complex-associated factor-like n=1 Tax=Asterias amurensis TaxID=7602 RepID=UPI003AB7DAC6